ncbi:nucleotide pyrophosphohydrolase [bacterium]|nr:MAG: nucleotide pyrophosphohydrolase [bacterium]
MSEIQAQIEALRQFHRERDWKQFHNPKDLAISLSLEASEVLELFQWKSPEEIAEFAVTGKQEIQEELADVFNWVLVMCDDLGIDIIKAAQDKLEKNKLKYPVDKAKGRHTKYNKLI